MVKFHVGSCKKCQCRFVLDVTYVGTYVALLYIVFVRRLNTTVEASTFVALASRVQLKNKPQPHPRLAAKVLYASVHTLWPHLQYD